MPQCFERLIQCIPLHFRCFDQNFRKFIDLLMKFHVINSIGLVGQPNPLKWAGHGLVPLGWPNQTRLAPVVFISHKWVGANDPDTTELWLINSINYKFSCIRRQKIPWAHRTRLLQSKPPPLRPNPARAGRINATYFLIGRSLLIGSDTIFNGMPTTRPVYKWKGK